MVFHFLQGQVPIVDLLQNNRQIVVEAALPVCLITCELLWFSACENFSSGTCTPFEKSVVQLHTTASMSQVSDLSVSLLKGPSKYIRPYRLSFTQVCCCEKNNAKNRMGKGAAGTEYLRTTGQFNLLTQPLGGSVSILIYHRERRCLIFVKQFRPGNR